MPKGTFEGVIVPVLTPFTADFEPDAPRFISLCKWLLDQGADGLAVFGSTSEANSMSLDQRERLLERLVESGVPAAKLMPGTGACALADVVRITRKAVTLGCGGVLMLPPFYYKAVSDDGVYAFVSQVIEQVGSAALRVYLYHIPPIAVVPFTVDLVGRLIKAYPKSVVGLKDSSGDWSNTQRLLREYPGFDVFPGSETFLLQGLRNGACGCISATAGVNTAAIRKVFESWQTDRADSLQDRISEVRKVIQSYPLVPALKAMMAHYHADPAWQIIAPPLLPLPDETARALISDLDAIGFAMAPAQAVSL